METLIKEVAVFSCIGCLVYMSKGSYWWTFVNGSLFVLFIYSIMQQIAGIQKNFTSKKELIDWANTLEE